MGMATIIIWGWQEFGSFIAGLEMITMMCFGNSLDRAAYDQNPMKDAQGNAYPGCGFYSERSPQLFSTIIVVTFIVTMLVSWMEKVLPQEQNKAIEEPKVEPVSAKVAPVRVESHEAMDEI